MAGDTVSVEEDSAEGAPLVAPVKTRGQRVAPAPSLDEIRTHAGRELNSLPDALRGLAKAPDYPVEIAERLRHLSTEADRRIEATETVP